MFRANPEHTGVFDNGGIVPGNMELWRFATGIPVRSSPAVSNGVVYVGSDNLYAIDAVTGKEKWRFAVGNGMYSSPAVSNGVIYVGSGVKNLYAIDAVTGTEKWWFVTGNSVESSPAVSNGIVYVGSDNLYAIDAVTGKEKWRFATGAAVRSSPAVSNGVVYVGSADNNLYAIDAVTGKEKWRFATRIPVSSSPAVSNGIVYVGGGDSSLYAIDAVTGKEKWRFVTGEWVYSSPAVANGIVYVGSKDKNLYAIDAVTGKEKWRFATGSEVGSSPAVSNGIVYVGSEDKNLYAIDAVTGKEKWRFATGGGASSPAVSNGVVYVGSWDNNLYAVGGVPSAPINTPTAVSTPVPTTPITLRPTPVPTIPPGDSNLTLPIVVIIVILLLAGGGYAIYRMKKTPSIDQPPVKKKVTEPIPDTIQRRTEQTILNQINEIRNNPAVSSSTKSELSVIANTIRGINLAETEHPLKTYARKQLDSINNTLTRIHEKGMVFIRSDRYDNIRQMIDAEKYMVAIVESDKFLANLAQSEEIYDKSTAYKTALPEPDLVSLYSAGKYASVIKIYEEKLAKIDQVNKLRVRVKQLNEDAEKVGAVPDSIKNNLQTQDIDTLEKTIRDLDSFIANAKPELTLSLDRTQLSTERWHKLGITLTNTGLADVENVAFAFSSEFETKGIKPISVKAGQSSRTDISIIPKSVGNILLEITLTYKDLKGRDYRTVQEFWIDVIEKGTTTIPHSETPSSPVSQFTPKPITLKQLPPELSDRYTESEFIGKGGFARVFKAKRKDGKYVAVKVPISLDASTGKSFIAEMQNWTKLSHPNIVRLYDFNIMPMPYFEEELCDSALADRNKPIECEEAAWILFNICEGLKFAHVQKIIHRDLKPQNILLKNGVPKISDWGLSRILSVTTTTSAMSFTPFYAAPEQINNRVKDERTDIWQLGVILYELVTGEFPFKGDSMVEIGMNIATKDPKRPGEIKPDTKVIDAVVMKCLEKDPKNRYQSVLELQKDLAMYLRQNYTELLKTSVSIKDFTQSASYCGDLVMINMHTGDLATSYKYLLDFVHYSKGDVKVEAQELSEQIKMRMEMGVTEIPDELIQKAEIIVHQVMIGSEKGGNKKNGLDSLFE